MSFPWPREPLPCPLPTTGPSCHSPPRLPGAEQGKCLHMPNREKTRGSCRPFQMCFQVLQGFIVPKYLRPLRRRAPMGPSKAWNRAARKGLCSHEEKQRDRDTLTAAWAGWERGSQGRWGRTTPGPPDTRWVWKEAGDCMGVKMKAIASALVVAWPGCWLC